MWVLLGHFFGRGPSLHPGNQRCEHLEARTEFPGHRPQFVPFKILRHREPHTYQRHSTGYHSVHPFALSPGVVRTRMYVEAGVEAALNTVELPAIATLYLTSGRADWLSGRSVEITTRSYESYCNDAHMFIQELLHELGHDRSGGRLERRDPRAESAC